MSSRRRKQRRGASGRIELLGHQEHVGDGHGYHRDFGEVQRGQGGRDGFVRGQRYGRGANDDPVPPGAERQQMDGGGAAGCEPARGRADAARIGSAGRGDAGHGQSTWGRHGSAGSRGQDAGAGRSATGRQEEMKRVAILGGGPAGAFAAEKLASAGLGVVLMDEKLAWEKPCGGALTHKAYSQYPFLIENSTPKRA